MFSTRPTGVPLGVWRRNMWLIFLIVSSEFAQRAEAEFSYESITAVLAKINVSYSDPVSKKMRSVTSEMGRFADGAIGPAFGALIQANPPVNSSRLKYLQGCVEKWASPPKDEPWVALFLRGGCPDEEKVKLAMSQNASAVMLFGGDPETPFQKDPKFKGDAVVIYLLRAKGQQLSNLLYNGTEVYVSITRGQEVNFRITSINRTSVLFVSVSFIVLMVVSLAWLIFYYIQRFRYINAKDRLARHLSNAAKKALAKIPVKNLKAGEKEIEDTESCAVCIEIYQYGDTVRSLPCKHQFHKSCVDPWLLEHRTCPMCKMDILKHYGYIQQNGGDGAGGNRSTPIEDTVLMEGGLARRNQEETSTSTARTTVQEPLQVSVISQPEVLPRIEPQEQASTNPASDGFIAIPTCHSSCLGTTPAVIRSMILSVRPPQVSSSDHCGAIQEDPVTPPPISIFEDSRTVNLQGGENPSSPNEEETSSCAELSSSVPIAIALTHAPILEEEKTLPVKPLNILPIAPPETSPPEVQDIPPSEESPVVSPTSEDDSSSSASSSPYQSSSDYGKADYIVYDIECLVKEISDLERDEANSEKNDKQLSNMGSETSLKTEKDTEEIEASEELKNPSSSCIITTGSKATLSKVDCEPQTQILAIDENQHSYNYPTRLDRSISSLLSEDGENIARRDSVLSSDERSSSAHIVTTTHS